MALHSNVYIPKESWPYWTWFAIEFGIVLTAALLISNEIMSVFDSMGLDESTKNWIFWGLFAILFFDWYIILRRLILKRPILENSYGR